LGVNSNSVYGIIGAASALCILCLLVVVVRRKLSKKKKDARSDADNLRSLSLPDYAAPTGGEGEGGITSDMSRPSMPSVAYPLSSSMPHGFSVIFPTLPSQQMDTAAAGTGGTTESTLYTGTASEGNVGTAAGTTGGGMVMTSSAMEMGTNHTVPDFGPFASMDDIKAPTVAVLPAGPFPTIVFPVETGSAAGPSPDADADDDLISGPVGRGADVTGGTGGGIALSSTADTIAELPPPVEPAEDLEGIPDKSVAHDLAMHHIQGTEGAPTDYKKAVALLRLAGEAQAERTVLELLQAEAARGEDEAAKQVALMNLDGCGTNVDPAAAQDWLERAHVSKDDAEDLVVKRMESNAPKDARVAVALANVYLQPERFLTKQLRAGRTEAQIQAKAVVVLDKYTRATDTEAALLRGNMLMEGKGVEVDVKKAEQMFTKAGKSREWMGKRVEGAVDSFGPRFNQLFRACDKDGSGALSVDEFAVFYTCCLEAGGMDSDRAIKGALAVYQGVAKHDAIFRSLTGPRRRTIDFETFWKDPHTNASLFPRTPHYIAAATRYFKGLNDRFGKDWQLHAMATSELFQTIRKAIRGPGHNRTKSNTELSPRGSVIGVPSPQEPATGTEQAMSAELSK